jgi:hypothetical protein
MASLRRRDAVDAKHYTKLDFCTIQKVYREKEIVRENRVAGCALDDSESTLE